MAIAENDFNESTDIAFCRRCDETYSFASLKEIAKVAPDTYGQFKLKYCSNDGFGKWMTIGFPKSILKILIPIACILGSIAMWAVYMQLVIDGTLSKDTLILIVVTVVLLLIIYTFAFGKWQIRIDHSSLQLKTGAFPFCIRKEIQLHKITAIKLGKGYYPRSDKTYRYIAVEPLPNSYEFGTNIKHDLQPLVLKWLFENIYLS